MKELWTCSSIVPFLQEVFELALQQGGCVADRVLHHATGDRAVMNGSVVSNGKDFLFAAGVDDSSQIFNLKFKVVKKKPHGVNSGETGGGWICPMSNVISRVLGVCSVCNWIFSFSHPENPLLFHFEIICIF